MSLDLNAVSHFEALPHGGVISAGEAGFGADFGAASGVDALLVMTGGRSARKAGRTPANAKAATVRAGSRNYTVMTISENVQHPQAKAEGDKVIVGGQTVYWDGKKLIFSKP